MIGRLNHVAIAVPDLEAAAAQYRFALGAKVGAPQPEPDHGVTVIFIELPNTKIELLHPLGEGSPILGFLEKNPSGGIHHICYEVDHIAALRRGDTAIGGKIPVNVSGGLACFGEAVPAQAIAQVCELTWQLRGEAGDRQVKGAKVGITANQGLFGHGSSVIVKK